MKNILFALLGIMILLPSCSNDESEKELELVYVDEHSYKYEDILSLIPVDVAELLYGSAVDGIKNEEEMITLGYGITEETYKLLENATLVLYVNDIKFDLEYRYRTWRYTYNEKYYNWFLVNISLQRASEKEEPIYGKYFLRIEITEQYPRQTWEYGNHVQNFLGIETGDRDIRLEFYK